MLNGNPSARATVDRRSILVTIIISNYNYGRFLPEAIESALSQTWCATEVVVVDDGSTDDSRDVISCYAGRVIVVTKDNGGMASAQNAGFRASHGQVIVFLDSDDTLAPAAAGSAALLFSDPDLVKVHWPIWEVDDRGCKTGRLIPGRPLPEGDLKHRLIAEGPDACVGPPIHGNAWSRAFLSRVLPIPEKEFRRHSDMYLLTLAPLFGTMKTIPQPQGCYRVHGANDYACRPVDEKNRRNLAMYDLRCSILKHHLDAMGIEASLAAWKQTAGYQWMQRRDRATEELKSLVPEGSTFILVDEQQWADPWGGGQVVASRQAIPFIERKGQYWGPPQDDEMAIRELERLRRTGAKYVAFAWPAFWWLDHYRGFAGHLRENFCCLLDNERLVVFDLQGTNG
jgi:glycosyl transferase family 2